MYHLVPVTHEILTIGMEPRPGDSRFGPAKETKTTDGEVLSLHRVGTILTDDHGDGATVHIVGNPYLTFEERRAMILFVQGELDKAGCYPVEKHVEPSWTWAGYFEER